MKQQQRRERLTSVHRKIILTRETNGSLEAKVSVVVDPQFCSAVMRTLYYFAALSALFASTFRAEKGGGNLVIDFRLPLAGQNSPTGLCF